MGTKFLLLVDEYFVHHENWERGSATRALAVFDTLSAANALKDAIQALPRPDRNDIEGRDDAAFQFNLKLASLLACFKIMTAPPEWSARWTEAIDASVQEISSF